MADTNGLQTWVSQLTTLTSQKSAESKKLATEDGEVSLSKKPPQGVNRKRPGTGRKLPSIPSDKSPINSENNFSVSNQNLVAGDALAGRMLDQAVSGRSSTGNISKFGVNSSQSFSRTTKNGYPASPVTSAGSRGSMDAEASLQGTETFTATVQARVSSRSNHNMKTSQDNSDDIASTVALVNGDNDYVTPILYKSPRDALAKRQHKDLSTKPGSATSTPPAYLGKKLVGKSYSQTVPIPKTVTTPRSAPSNGANKSIVSDVFSRKDSMDNDSIISDMSSETGDGSQSRPSSKGKGAITMTRTNKTFELRCARADSLDAPPTIRSAKPSTPSKSGAISSVGRSHSLYSSTRNKPVMDTSRSEATSLGAQIVKKSQSNITQEKVRKAASTVLSRTDSGSQKLQRASSLTISQPIPGGKREPTSKSHLRSTPTGRSSLTITGISSIPSRSQSQPGSRSNSPKSAEKMAWKRRKEYDARKSVAVAKASKVKESNTSGVTMRSKLLVNSSIHTRMTRSASFTNTAAGFSLCPHNSVSSSQDISDRKEPYHQHEDLRKAFIPFLNSHHNGRATHSADEDDSFASAASTQDNAKSLVALLEIPSAFTPPLLGNMPVSPVNSSPSEASLSLRRRTLHMDEKSSSSVTNTPHSNGDSGDTGRCSAQSSFQTSYDSLIVTSVHQLSLKLKISTDKILNKLRDENRMAHTPSPVDDFLNDSGKSEIMAWKTANQELASTLKNLRMLERRVQIMNAALFPDIDINSEVSSDASKRQGKQKLLEDIEKKFGFQPIVQPTHYPHPDENDVASPEMAELSGQF